MFGATALLLMAAVKQANCTFLRGSTYDVHGCCCNDLRIIKVLGSATDTTSGGCGERVRAMEGGS